MDHRDCNFWHHIWCDNGRSCQGPEDDTCATPQHLPEHGEGVINRRFQLLETEKSDSQMEHLLWCCESIVRSSSRDVDLRKNS